MNWWTLKSPGKISTGTIKLCSCADGTHFSATRPTKSGLATLRKTCTRLPQMAISTNSKTSICSATTKKSWMMSLILLTIVLLPTPSPLCSQWRVLTLTYLDRRIQVQTRPFQLLLCTSKSGWTTFPRQLSISKIFLKATDHCWWTILFNSHCQISAMETKCGQED